MEWVLLIVVLGLIVPFLLPAKGLSPITINETKDKLAEDHVQLIDVRTPGDYQGESSKEI